MHFVPSPEDFFFILFTFQKKPKIKILKPTYYELLLISLGCSLTRRQSPNQVKVSRNANFDLEIERRHPKSAVSTTRDAVLPRDKNYHSRISRDRNRKRGFTQDLEPGPPKARLVLHLRGPFQLPTLRCLNVKNVLRANISAHSTGRPSTMQLEHIFSLNPYERVRTH